MKGITDNKSILKSSVSSSTTVVLYPNRGRKKRRVDSEQQQYSTTSTRENDDFDVVSDGVFLPADIMEKVYPLPSHFTSFTLQDPNSEEDKHIGVVEGDSFAALMKAIDTPEVTDTVVAVESMHTVDTGDNTGTVDTVDTEESALTSDSVDECSYAIGEALAATGDPKSTVNR